MANLKKVKLSDGSVYSFFDEGAFRLNEDKVLITGNKVVDKVILEGSLHIVSIDDVPVEAAINSVLVQDPETGLIRKRSVNQLLEDIGGISCEVQSDKLILKVGK